MYSFEVPTKPYDDRRVFYKDRRFDFDYGVNVLVGCNGTGKSTVISLLKDKLKEENKPCLVFDCKREHNWYKDSLIQDEDYSTLATYITSSEGECTNVILHSFVRKLLGFFKKYPEGDKFILLDSIDSGYSLDNVIEFNKFLVDTVCKGRDNDVYFIVSTNAYEMVEGNQCFYARTGEKKTFNSYEEYRKFILKSFKDKQRRK